VDGRLVLLGLIVALAVYVTRDMQPAVSAEQLAREQAADEVLIEVDRTQQCYYERRERYTDSVTSLQFARGRFMRKAYENRLDIQLEKTRGGYAQRVTGDTGIDAYLERRGREVVRLEGSGGGTPAVADGC
jgi:hypothetical protein